MPPTINSEEQPGNKKRRNTDDPKTSYGGAAFFVVGSHQVRSTKVQMFWANLSITQRKYARILQYDRKTWNSCGSVPTHKYPWSSLNARHKEAAMCLFNEKDWPCKMREKTLTIQLSKKASKKKRKNETPTTPTDEDISSALCAIDYYDTDKVTRDEVIKALHDLNKWRHNYCPDVDSVTKLTDIFVKRCAGIPRILRFIKRNKNDIALMGTSVWVLGRFLNFGKNKENLASSIKVSKKFVKNDGIEQMVSVILHMLKGELGDNQLQALQNIWVLFQCLIHNINQNNVVDMDKTIPIMDCGISTLDVINKIGDDKDILVDIKTKLFATFCHIMKNAEMIDDEEFEGKDIFYVCVCALKNADGGDNNSWKYNTNLWNSTSLFFYTCCKENRTLLSKAADFDLIVPFLIQFIREDTQLACGSCAFYSLVKACDIIGKEKMLDYDGILEVLGRVADNRALGLAFKNKAKQSIKRLLL